MQSSMQVGIELSDDDIKFAESILLGDGEKFDEERVNFIKNLDTIDLQAVPGSGKTTALVAKLIALESKLPFKDGSGVLVISHTNAAINEIKKVLSFHCPKMMNYPNFIGTIQSFVNSFFAQQYIVNQFDSRINIIDDSRFKKELWFEFEKIKWNGKYEKLATYFWQRHLNSSRAEARNSDLTVKEICLKKIEREVKNLYYDFRDDTIKNIESDVVILKNQNSPKFKGLKKCILNVIENGVISFKYAYKLAFHYLILYPSISDLIRKRFKFVFVDEMQDMNYDQYNLLETLFYNNGDSNSIFQRIGDKNQSIYDGKLIDDQVWIDRDNLLSIKGSHRLTIQNANLVGSFALFGTFDDEDYLIRSLSGDGLKPQIIVYDNDSIENVIPYYTELISQLKKEGRIEKSSKYPNCVVAWNTDWRDDRDREDENKIRLIDYYPEFKKDRIVTNEEYPNLMSTLYSIILANESSNEIMDKLIKIILKVFQLEGITDLDDKRLTKTKFLSTLKKDTEHFEFFKESSFQTCKEIINKNIDGAYKIFSNYLKKLIKEVIEGLDKSRTFIISKEVDPILKSVHFTDSEINKLNINDVEIHLKTVHSVKGKTHSSTLYLESSYYLQYESQRLSNQFCGTPFPSDEARIRHKHSTVMAYVGLSRAKELICVGIHKDRFNNELKDLDKENWDIHIL